MNGVPEPHDIALIVVDVQERFRPVIFEFDRVVANCSKLIRGFNVLGLPIVPTEQYPKGLGFTIPEISGLLKDKPLEKMEFSCMKNADFAEKVKSLNVRALALCGIEAHVCVLQTCLDAIQGGWEVYFVEDAISSRRDSDWRTAAARVSQSGIWRVSTEMLLFQLMDKAGGEEFKEIQRIVK